VTRILWLEGSEPGTKNAQRRNIYIHGTPEEKSIGKPASFGCIRMKSRDIIDLYRRVGLGAEVVVTTKKIPAALRNLDEPEDSFIAAPPAAVSGIVAESQGSGGGRIRPRRVEERQQPIYTASAETESAAFKLSLPW
jgi:hypothetical protein